MFLIKVHDLHHPIRSDLYYEDQKEEALKKVPNWKSVRLPKFLDYLERVLKFNGKTYLLGEDATYPDLALFHLVAGLNYTFPKRMDELKDSHPLVFALADRVAERKNIKSYLSSPRRKPFNTSGIFR